LTKRIFITATNTDIGKTYTTLRLMECYSDMGYRVGVLKPIETGVSTEAPDATLLLQKLHQINPESLHLNIDDIAPIQLCLPAAPYVAKARSSIDLTLVDRALEKMEQICDICLIEGAGGLLVPIGKNYFIIDLIKRFDALALLISHCNLGCINDTLLSLEALKHREIQSIWALNCHNTEKFKSISKPYFDECFDEYFIVDRDIEQICQKLLLSKETA